MLHKVDYTIAIQSSASISNALTDSNLRFVESLTIYPPVTLDSQTFSVEVTPSDGASAAGSTYRNLTTAGSNVTVLADKAVVITCTPYRGLRITSDGTVSAARTFNVTAHERR